MGWPGGVSNDLAGMPMRTGAVGRSPTGSRLPEQARRLVKNSIIAVDAPDEDVGEDDFVEDAQEMADVLGHQRGDGDGGDGAQGGGDGGADGGDGAAGEGGAADGARRPIHPCRVML